MCEFISWKEVNTEKGKEILFLTSNDIYNTKRGRELQKHTISRDFVGHGAIAFYFETDKGENKECTDFSTPNNFPPVIVQAIKEGRFRGLGSPTGLLNADGLVEYEKVKQSAWAKYQKVKQSAFWDTFANMKYRNPSWV